MTELKRSTNGPLAYPYVNKPDYIPKHPRRSEKIKFLGYHQPGLKIGRNEECPCGSGLKYKKCCINNPENLKNKLKGETKK